MNGPLSATVGPAARGPAAGGPATAALARAVLGLLCGTVPAGVLALGIIVARARIEDIYFHSADQVLGWVGIVSAALALVLAALAWKSVRLLARALAGGGLGLVAGVTAGAAAGQVLSQDPAWAWAGGVMGGALAMLAGIIAAVASRRLHRGRAAVALTIAVAALSCGDRPLPRAPAVELAEPDPAEVESVVLLFGDAGLARFRTHPILPRLRQDVETWSERLEADSAVVVLSLGDFIYPDGLDPPGGDEFLRDAAIVREQVAVITGETARARGSRFIFVAGNHDWGEEEDWEGTRRLLRVEALLEQMRTRDSIPAFLLPRAGSGGPAVLDLGGHLRIILLDTAWWLFGSEPVRKRAVLDGVEEALAGAGERRVVVAAHHPLRSGGPHGQLVERSLLSLVRLVLSRSGAWLQDLHSEPYRDLRLGLDGVFRSTRPPDLFAGGHEHSAQVLEAVLAAEPPTMLVVGSASKLTPVGPAPGMLLGSSSPAYARLFALRDGRLQLFVQAADDEYLECPEQDPERAACITKGERSYRTIWAGELPRPRAAADRTAEAAPRD